MVDYITTIVLHQSYRTQCHSLFTLITYYGILFSFIIMFTDNWFTYCAMALCIISIY